jgi:hypothetical protein
MFEQKQRVRLLARQNRAFDSFLNFKCRRVINTAQTFNLQASPSHEFSVVL